MPRWTVVPVTAVLAALVLAGCGSNGAAPGGGGALTVTDDTSLNPVQPGEPTPESPSVAPPASADSAGTASFAGVEVTHALDTSTEPGVTSRSSTAARGLLVDDLVAGDGPQATPTSKVSVHYRGVLYADGTEFDANYGTADPTPIDLATAVSGFAQGVGGGGVVGPMKVGGRRLVVFPASLGYGATGTGPIPAHASLVFVIDLLGVS